MVNYSENVYVRRGLDGRSHIPALPFWLAIVRVIQLLLAFLVLVLTAYSSATFSNDGTDGNLIVQTLFPGYNMSFFTFAWTILFLLYIFLTPLIYPKFYHSYAHLGLEFLTVIFWLTTFALLADECKWWVAEQDSLEAIKKLYKDFGSNNGSGYSGEVNKLLSACKASRAATGIAAIVWILFMVTLGFVVYYWNKHRAENGATGLSFGRNKGTSDVEAAQVEKTNAPVELNNVQGHPEPQHSAPVA